LENQCFFRQTTPRFKPYATAQTSEDEDIGIIIGWSSFAGALLFPLFSLEQPSAFSSLVEPPG
jgi:hypothetical protein